MTRDEIMREYEQRRRRYLAESPPPESVSTGLARAPEETDDAYLARFRAMLESGEIGDDASAARYHAELDRQAARERARRERIQLGRLSARHIGDAARVVSGGLPPSGIWRRLFAALRAHPGASILLVGHRGAGKTTAATGYAVERVRAGWTVLALTPGRASRIARFEEAREEAERVDLLLLDQMHFAGEIPGWILVPLVELINTRYEHHRQTIAIATTERAKVETLIGADIVERFDLVLGTNEHSYRGRT